MNNIIFYFYICSLGFEAILQGRFCPCIIDYYRAYNMLRKLEFENFTKMKFVLEVFKNE